MVMAAASLTPGQMSAGPTPAVAKRSAHVAPQMRAEAFVPAVVNYYMTDAISRASPTMAECTAAAAPLAVAAE